MIAGGREPITISALKNASHLRRAVAGGVAFGQ
jgi:hypothetical protein